MDFPSPEDIAFKASKNGASVQAREADKNEWFSTPGMLSSFLFPIAQMADTIPAWSIYPFQRDRFLRTFFKTEPHFAGATYSMAAFAKTLNLRLDGPPRAKKYAQTLLNDCEDGQGYRALIEMSAIDLFTTDNGCFWELVGAGNPERPLTGALQPPYVLHMDSLLCWRTMDKEYPVIYMNPLDNSFHRMHRTRVVFRSSMRQPDELARGIGFCAASRILRYSQRLRDILIFQHEKVAGNFTRALGLLKGINAFELAQSDEQSREAALSKGYARYRGINFLGKAATDIDAKIIDLASIGDGYDEEKTLTMYMYCLALAYGVDAREFWPATASGATKADATIQDMKTQGKGKGDIISTFEGMWRDVFPDTVEAEYDYSDDAQDLQRATIATARVDSFIALKTGGIIDADEARAHLINENVLNPDYLKDVSPEEANAQSITDQTPEGDVVIGLQGQPEIAPQGDQPMQVQAVGQPPQPQPSEPPQQEVKKKELQATRLDFENAFDNVLQGAKNADYTRAQAERLLYRLIQRYGTQGYVDGLIDGGVEIADSSELERDDLRTITRMLNAQSGYVNDFMGTVFDGDVSDTVLEGKAEQWFNGSIMPFYQAGLTASGANPMVEFAGDDGLESCVDCKRLKGQRHRLQDWVDRGFDPPNGINLECHAGHHCAHTLVRVRGRERGSW